MITMKKFIAIIALAGVAVFSAACESNSKSSGTSDSGSSSSHVSDNSAAKAVCDTEAASLGSDWSQFSDLITEAQNDGTAVYLVAEIKDAANRGISASRSWISECGSYYPSSQVQAVRTAMDEAQTAVDAL